METLRTRLVRLSLIALVAAGAGRASGADRTSLPHPIWPIPQEARYADDRLLLRDAVIVVPRGEPRAQYPGRLLAALVADQFGVALPVVVETAPAESTPILVGEASNPLLAAAVARVPVSRPPPC